MKVKILLAVSLLFSLFLTSCKEKEPEASQVYLVTDLPPIDPFAEMSSGGTRLINIGIVNNEGEIKTVKITQFYDGLKDIEVLKELNHDDITREYNHREFVLPFTYIAPQISSSDVISTLKFYVENTNGKTFVVTKTVKILNSGRDIFETVPIKLFAGGEFNRRVLNIKENASDKNYFVTSVGDEGDICTVTGESDEIMRVLKSTTDVLFYRTTNIDFDKAGVTAIQAEFNNAFASPDTSPIAAITDIQQDDVIIVGRGENVIAIFKITGIHDEEGTDKDYYTFNIRLVK